MSSLSEFDVEQKRSSFSIFKPLFQNVCSDICVGCGTDTQEVTGYNTSFFSDIEINSASAFSVIIQHTMTMLAFVTLHYVAFFIC